MLFTNGPLFIHTQCISLSLSLFFLFFLFWFYPSPANGHPPCLANQKSIKNTSTPSLESYPGWGKDRGASRTLCLSQAHTHTLSLSSSSRDLSSRLLHSQAPPSCLLEVGNMIYEKRGRNLYIFFPRASSHLFIRFLFLSLVERRMGLVESGWGARPADWQACRHGADLSLA